ncbi:MAG: glutathione synthase, partial [Gemmatimonadetes bacterium]|nr:glutathione synthase [Gemmatimonadota bacterium]
DKRINVFGFEVISAVTTRPAEGSFICHESSGGTAHADEISARDEHIVSEVLPFLREHDIWWAGIDVIGPYLGEINITTPTMIRRADEAHGSTRGRDLVVRRLAEFCMGEQQ